MTMHDDKGETLIEIIIAIAILGIVVAGVLGGLGTAIIGYRIHRHGAQLDTLAEQYAERAKAQIQLQVHDTGKPVVPYASCALPATGPDVPGTYHVDFTVPASYSPDVFETPYIAGIEVMNPSDNSFAASVPGCSDAGVQRLDVLARTKAAPPITEHFQVIVRAR